MGMGTYGYGGVIVFVIALFVLQQTCCDHDERFMIQTNDPLCDGPVQCSLPQDEFDGMYMETCENDGAAKVVQHEHCRAVAMQAKTRDAQHAVSIGQTIMDNDRRTIENTDVLQAVYSDDDARRAKENKQRLMHLESEVRALKAAAAARG